MGSKYTIVKVRPSCDICEAQRGIKVAAYADAKLAVGDRPGTWAYVCRFHFNQFQCELGFGHGQALVLRPA